MPTLEELDRRELPKIAVPILLGMCAVMVALVAAAAFSAFGVSLSAFFDPSTDANALRTLQLLIALALVGTYVAVTVATLARLAHSLAASDAVRQRIKQMLIDG